MKTGHELSSAASPVNWAATYIAALRRGETIQCRPKGGSMSGRIESGQLVTVAPVKWPTDVHEGDIVMVTIGAWAYVHLVKEIAHVGREYQYQIGNNRGKINGWAPFSAIHGRVIKVED